MSRGRDEMEKERVNVERGPMKESQRERRGRFLKGRFLKVSFLDCEREKAYKREREESYWRR